MQLSSNVVGDSNDKNNFLDKLLLTNIQVSELHKPFENDSSGNIKLSKPQFDKTGQSGEFLGRLLGPLLKTCFYLLKTVLKSIAKSVLMPLVLTTAASATDAAIQKKVFESGMTALINSNEEMNDIIWGIWFIDKTR